MTGIDRLKLSNPTTFIRQTTNIHSLLRQLFPLIDGPMVQPSPLISVLLGISSPAAPAPHLPVEYLDARLNESQREAVDFALSATEIGLIWGPPGMSLCFFSDSFTHRPQRG